MSPISDMLKYMYLANVSHVLFQLMVVTATGVCIPPVVQLVGEVNRSEQGCATTPPHSTMEKAANGLDQLMKQGPVILSIAQVS